MNSNSGVLVAAPGRSSIGPSNTTTSIVTPLGEHPDDEKDTFSSWHNMTRTLAHYERQEQIGEGTYGQVYRARCKDTGRVVALKKMRMHHGGYWGMPLQFIREIKILKKLTHPNLLQMIEVVTSKGVEELDEDDPITKPHSGKANGAEKDRVSDARESYKGNLFLVLEYVSHDLTGLMDVAYQFTEVQVKCIFRQLLEACAYMHQHKYVHRDIKSSNILLDSHFRVKLADFGLARNIEPPLLDQMHDRSNSSSGSSSSSVEFTNKVITLWYRPPEILTGATQYGPAVDVWSAGCILAELLLGKPLLPGKSDLEQLKLIADMLGTPAPDTWDYLSSMKRVRSGEITLDMRKPKMSRLRDKYAAKIPTTAMNLLDKLLAWDPRKRLTATGALQNKYFWSQPVAPEDPAELGEIQVGPGGHFHEFQTKKKRKEAKIVAEAAREKAKFKGATEEEAQDEFDNVYRGLMKKVAQEGLGDVGKKKEIQKPGLVSTQSMKKDIDTVEQDESSRRRREETDSRSDRPKHHRDKERRSSGDKSDRRRNSRDAEDFDGSHKRRLSDNGVDDRPNKRLGRDRPSEERRSTRRYSVDDEDDYSRRHYDDDENSDRRSRSHRSSKSKKSKRKSKDRPHGRERSRNDRHRSRDRDAVLPHIPMPGFEDRRQEGDPYEAPAFPPMGQNSPSREEGHNSEKTQNMSRSDIFPPVTSDSKDSHLMEKERRKDTIQTAVNERGDRDQGAPQKAGPSLERRMRNDTDRVRDGRDRRGVPLREGPPSGRDMDGFRDNSRGPPMMRGPPPQRNREGGPGHFRDERRDMPRAIHQPPQQERDVDRGPNRFRDDRRGMGRNQPMSPDRPRAGRDRDLGRDDRRGPGMDGPLPGPHGSAGQYGPPIDDRPPPSRSDGHPDFGQYGRRIGNDQGPPEGRRRNEQAGHYGPPSQRRERDHRRR
jgi:cyclin-dependent kinase 12/13